MKLPISVLLPSIVLLSGCDASRPSLTLESAAPIVRDGRLTEAVGIETAGGTFTRLLEPGETVPASKSEVFSTAADNQEQIKISVYRGTRELVTQNRLVSAFEIHGLSPAERGTPQIEVTFEVSEAGDISVRATDLSTKRAAEVRKIPPARPPD